MLVRLLEPQTFGQYREFMVYAMLVSMLATFSIKSNLLYFIPRDAERSRSYVINTIWITFGMTLVACAILYVFRGPILANTSFDFLVPLSIYVLLFINLDFLETYWLAKKQPTNVFYYSVARTIVRLSAVLGTAMYLPTVEALLAALIVVEAVRIVIVMVLMQRLHLKLAWLDRRVLHDQLVFIVPLGLAGSLQHVNHYIGQIAISTQLGVIALAIYTIGSYQIPILGIIRGSINDSIFPDMVRQAASKEGDNLQLWKRSNVAYTSLIVPIFVLLFCYADVLIPLAFTDQYSRATPIFRILVMVMVIQCFEFSSPLRAVNRNKILLASNVLMLCVNVGIIISVFHFMPLYGIYGPAIAIVSAYIVQLMFLGLSITQVYSIPPSQLMKWRSLAIIYGSAAISSVALLIGQQVNFPDFIRLPVFSLIFVVCYFLLMRRARVEEFETVVNTLTRKLRRT